MATYGKKRHILPVLSASRGSTDSLSSKRPKHGIRGSLETSAPPIYSNEMGVSASLCRRDSIEEMADILLDDTAVEGSRVGHTMKVDLSDNHAPKQASSHRKGDRISTLPPGVTIQRKLTGMNSTEEASLDDGRLEGILPSNTIEAGGFSPVHDGVSQTKPLTRNPANPNGNLEAMARTAEGLNQDRLHSLSLESHRLHDQQSLSNKNPHEEAKLGELSVNGPLPTNPIENGGSSRVSHGVLPAKSSIFNAVDLNNKVEAMLAATRALKPDASSSLRPGPPMPAQTSRPKNGNVLTKMRTAMNHIHGRSNKKSPEPANPQGKEEVVAQPSVASMELRMNEGGNLKNPKITSLTGHGKIRRKPLPDDGKLLRSQNASLYQFVQSKSEPILELSSDMPSNSVEPLEADNTTEPFPSYDTDFDVPFSSSPFAQSTPRIRVKPSFADGSGNGDYSDMDLDIKGSEMVHVVRRDVSYSKESHTPARTGYGRMKKHPSPSKAELEKWEDIISQFPAIDDSKSRGQDAHQAPVNVYLRPSSVLGYKSTNTKLHELTDKRDKGKGVGTLRSEVLGVAEPSTVMEDAPRNKDRKSFVSKHRRSKTGSRETRSSRSQSSVFKNETRMDTDELQWDMTPLLRKST